MRSIQLQSGHPLDVLDLRSAVLGGGLVLDHVADGGLVLYSVKAGHAHHLGCFERVADAWQAVDDLDPVPAAGDGPRSAETAAAWDLLHGVRHRWRRRFH